MLVEKRMDNNTKAAEYCALFTVFVDHVIIVCSLLVLISLPEMALYCEATKQNVDQMQNIADASNLK